MICKLEKADGEFTFSGKTRLRCQQCNIEKCVAWYERNKARKRKNSLDKYNKQNEQLRELKRKSCIDCGKSFPAYAMHFDHLNDKKFTLSKAQQRNWNDVLEEIKKCELVCGNCHAVRTHLRQCKKSPCLHG